MILKLFYIFCPSIIDDDEIKTESLYDTYVVIPPSYIRNTSNPFATRDNSSDSISTILPPDFIPENEFKHHKVRW